jgi:hypothetical protein
MIFWGLSWKIDEEKYWPGFWLVEAAQTYGVQLRQSYVRVGKRAAVKVSRYAHAKQFKRMRKQLRKLRTYVGRLIRDIRRKAGDVADDPPIQHARLRQVDRPDAGDQRAGRVMPVADDLPAAPGVIHNIGVELDPVGDLRFNRLPQQALRPVAQNLGQQITARGWNRLAARRRNRRD